MNTTDTTPPLAPVASLSQRVARLMELVGGKHAVVLGGFSLVATLLLTVAYSLTKAPIEQSALEDLRHSLEQVIPASIHDNNPAGDTLELLVDGAPVLVYRARQTKQITGVAFETNTSGYSGDIRLLLGIDKNGQLLGVRVLHHTETPGLGDKIEVTRTDWITRFTGKSLTNPPEEKWAVKKDGGPFDQFAGATITPRAVVKGVRDGLRLFAAHRDELLQEAQP
ncbi:electron transport complex subunit RsxG [Rhodoferax sp. U2-2l]|uniref:electron transport complex subunit RsxG n=1 Tax=Rhodoferax sp. U2-2l TaxID=2884000 RepID=UPI001D0BD5AD|nr:electron transport complex subunit RsxG [Rhodoferax sp. U2-2l]MCB8748061.1 electron transport complex subunit RsxG [Rhodoferax sp. U2-2l]